jgi:hypothetical protein
MTKSAFFRMPLRDHGSLQRGNWALRTSDRRGQDKSRKVRPVGWVGDRSNFNKTPNIAGNQHNFSFLIELCFHSAFDTLRRA